MRFKSLKDFLVSNHPAVFILTAFLFWIFIMRGFLFGGLSLESDAISYYEHIQFFVRHIVKGEFPLWDPYWSGGVPNDFFLRRIGPYNPFLFVIVFLYKSGIPYYFAYLWYLAFYFFLGMTGLFLLSKRLSGNTTAALLAFFVLIFSALGTRIFDSYMIFITTPLIWFFYFLVSFFERPSKTFLLGISFTLMLLMTTYIPFYFVLIVMFFLAAFVVVYCHKLLGFVRTALTFFGREKILTLLCVLAVVTVILPGFLFFKDAGHGNISIPGRHAKANIEHALAVQNQAEDPWALPEEFYFSAYYSDLHRIVFAIVYVPFFAFIVLAVGVGMRVSRLLVFLSLWGTLLFLFGSPMSSPLYKILYDKVFFIKYFRNLHFLLWFALLPIFAVFLGDQFRSFIAACGGRYRKVMAGYVVVIHGIVFCLMLHQSSMLFSSYLVLALSAVLLTLAALGKLDTQGAFFRWALLVVVLIQPLEVFYYFSGNVNKGHAGAFYDQVDGKFHYTNCMIGEGEIGIEPNAVCAPIVIGGLYYVTNYYNTLLGAFDSTIVQKYQRHKFILFDQVERLKDDNDFNRIKEAFSSGEDTALVTSDYPREKEIYSSASLPRRIEKASSDFEVLKYDVNSIVLQTNLKSPAFLVLNDAYHPDWQASVNGKSSRIWRANGAFKGLEVPGGKAKIVFRFSSQGRYLLNYCSLFICYGIFIFLLISAYKDKERFSKEVSYA